MADLTQRQRLFVNCYLATGGRATKAAIEAGYSAKGAAVAGCRLLRNPAILDAIGDATRKALAGDVALGRKVLVELATSAKSEETRLNAARQLLDRGGLLIAQQIEHRHRIDGRTDDEIVAALKSAFAETPQLRAMLAAPVIDGQTVEIGPHVDTAVDARALPVALRAEKSNNHGISGDDGDGFDGGPQDRSAASDAEIEGAS